ncbi:thioredoxin family protein [Bremerella sp. JC770]|uniref:thioredoxin family protein n=1 Tax=Bremerella sp. JC770 TaxID=3232137 RepID=UPI00345AF59A
MNESPSPTTSSTESAPKSQKVIPFWRIFWLTFLVVSLAYAWYCFYAPSNHIAWADNVPAAQQQAAKTGKPMILVFTGQWCVPCRIMKRQVWADPQVTAAVNAEFIPVIVDVDDPESAPLLDRYQVGGPPVTIVTDPQGEPLRWRAGGIGKAEFLELIHPPSPAAADET